MDNIMMSYDNKSPTFDFRWLREKTTLWTDTRCVLVVYFFFYFSFIYLFFFVCQVTRVYKYSVQYSSYSVYKTELHRNGQSGTQLQVSSERHERIIRRKRSNNFHDKKKKMECCAQLWNKNPHRAAVRFDDTDDYYKYYLIIMYNVHLLHVYQVSGILYIIYRLTK